MQAWPGGVTDVHACLSCGLLLRTLTSLTGSPSSILGRAAYPSSIDLLHGISLSFVDPACFVTVRAQLTSWICFSFSYGLPHPTALPPLRFKWINDSLV